jgi:hypothetical protein
LVLTAYDSVVLGWASVVIWIGIGLTAVLFPEAYARLGGFDGPHVRTHPIRGYISYGAHVRLVGTIMCIVGGLMAYFGLTGGFY